MQAGREIKFRGKPLEDYGDVKWFYGSAVLDYEERLAYIVSPGQGHVPVQWESVGQYTGLRDKTDKEIYEGDILGKTSDLSGQTYFYRVEWDHGNARFIAKRAHYQELVSSSLERCCEVVGNIYEAIQTHR
ncbi:YopX family protein [Brevibacillus parabrevis]|uniref:YopX family protein n=1 Tax=Brevibacillus parabrevis TaxID=54914 RepID=UPI003D248231